MKKILVFLFKKNKFYLIKYKNFLDVGKNVMKYKTDIKNFNQKIINLQLLSLGSFLFIYK